MAVKLNDPLRSKIVDSGIVAWFGTNAILQIYGGSRPAVAGDTTNEPVIVQISGISWSASSNGTAALSAVKTGTANGTAGTATWARLAGTSGVYVLDGLCGTSVLNDFVIDIEVIAGTSVVTLSTATIVQPAG